MRKVLFIAHDFPPCAAMGGALRSERFARYLPDFGWQPVVVSLEQKNVNYADDRAAIRLPSATPFSWPYQISPYGWAYRVYRHISLSFSSTDFDLIYVSCPPFPQAMAALKLKNHFSLPLVVDFRDAWSLDPYCEGSLLKRFLYKKVFPRVEKKLLCNADAFIANTASMASAYQELYPSLGTKTTLIPNGFDEADFSFQKASPAKKSNGFNLVYCGRFGIGGRDPSLLLSALKAFEEKHGKVIKLTIVGDDSDSVRDSVARHGLRDSVKLIAAVPHQQALKFMCEASALLLYQQSSDSPVSAIAGKTYEYLRSGKPIFALLPPGDNLELLRRYCNHLEITTDYTKDSVLVGLERLFYAWRDDCLQRNQAIGDEYLQKYERRALTQRLAQIFDLQSISQNRR